MGGFKDPAFIARSTDTLTLSDNTSVLNLAHTKAVQKMLSNPSPINSNQPCEYIIGRRDKQLTHARPARLLA